MGFRSRLKSFCRNLQKAVDAGKGRDYLLGMETNNNGAETMTETTNLRAQYRNALDGLLYDGNATAAQVTLAVIAMLVAKGLPETPGNFVAAVEAVRVPCRRCSGTGDFITGSMNGKPTGPGGKCFKCGGAGTQDHKDGHRNRVHFNHNWNR